ncbi:MAG: DUF1641 domain-containing protein [Proteobacteria bacterium]|jgi:uncharacterized protein YjgD (DUF1641 family)|nr:DUF1641 domain-containing protein [Pseudomonadota bacterium]
MSDQILEAIQKTSQRMDKLEERLASMDRLLERMEGIEQTLDTVCLMQERAPVLVDGMAHTVDLVYDEATKRGIDFVERGQLGLELMEKASEPKTMALINRLLERTDLLELAADVSERFAKLGKTAEFKEFLDNDMLEPKTFDIAHTTTQALLQTHKEGHEPVGPFGALMAMRDPAVQRTVGFTLGMARRFGQMLDN